MTYENYFNSLKDGDIAMSLIEFEQSLEGKKELAVYTVKTRIAGRYGKVTHFTVLANTQEEAKRLIAFNSYPNDYGRAVRLYGILEIRECSPVSNGVGLIDYITETVGL